MSNDPTTAAVSLPASLDMLRGEILALLEEDDVPEDEDNLIDYGLDSVRIMALATRWRQAGAPVDFVALAKKPTLAHWWALLSSAR